MEFDLKAFWRYKTTLLISTLAGLTFSICYLAFGTPTYQAIARVLVEPQGLTKTADTKSSVRVEPELLPTQAETIRSPALISEVLRKVSVELPRGTDPSKFDPVRHVLKSLTVTPVLKANVLTVAYRSSNADEALQLIEGLVDAHRKRIADADCENIKGRLEVAQTTETTLRADRDKLTHEYDELRRQSPMLGKGREADAQLLNHLRLLGDELSVTRKQRLDLEAKVALVAGIWKSENESTAVTTSEIGFVRGNGDESMPFDEVVNKYSKLVSPEDAFALRELSEKLTKAQFAVTELKMAYGAKHPNMILAKNEEANCEQLVRQRIESITGGWYQQLRLLQEAEKNLAAEFEKEERQVKSSENFLVQEQHLLDEINKVERLHEPALREVLSLKSEQEGIASGRQSINVIIIDGPAIIDEMTWPQPKVLIASCCILGLTVGLGLVLIKESVLASPSKLAGRRATDVVGQRLRSNSDDDAEDEVNSNWGIHGQASTNKHLEVIA
jgi:uncharacterized protein involved in exopolysaccharide biosynthesis